MPKRKPANPSSHNETIVTIIIPDDSKKYLLNPELLMIFVKFYACLGF